MLSYRRQAQERVSRRALDKRFHGSIEGVGLRVYGPEGRLRRLRALSGFPSGTT